MGCSSSCVCIAKYESIYPPTTPLRERERIEFIVPEIRITRPSRFVRISLPVARDENLLWEHWQPKECRSHSHRRCCTQGCGLNHSDGDFNSNLEHSPYLVDYWTKKMTFLDRHREISREMSDTWDFLDGKPLQRDGTGIEDEYCFDDNIEIHEM